MHDMVDINSEQTRDEAQHDLVVSELSSFGPLGPSIVTSFFITPTVDCLR